MKNSAKIASLIRQIANSGAYEIHQGFVKAVGNDGTIDVEIDDDVMVFGVRINVIPDLEFGIRLTPELESPCVIAKIEDGQDFQLLQCAKLEKLAIRVGSILFEIDKDKIFMNEGKNGGMVLLNPLISELKKLETNTTILRQACASLSLVCDGIAPGTSAAFNSAVSGIQPVNTSTLENTKVRQ